MKGFFLHIFLSTYLNGYRNARNINKYQNKKQFEQQIYKIIKSHLQKGELRKALDILEEMINKGAQDLEIFLYLGKIYFELNDYKKSIFYYKKCNQIKKNCKCLFIDRCKRGWKDNIRQNHCYVTELSGDRCR